mmetsp:Transcript_12122/g.34110  ORF Transcript_12122/g.34110 Transcript_12122/m.34110 type:complete len:451 (+) Transcript_12122:188-1540(+)|eukprot:CAMPEP_0117684090 /NCGR_PEP_ID=MMETSP0804-20121206/20861_1 /TAXON_ID=1074897 /ORGANISM="Tetraselmis astigmatica, Strain CCMP880" /LENGTH=450 /DNA_ID=CAMNT_0005494953 /DNA_START=138 /DNA_END=1490 /DNA_ORIENTATION=-
MGNRIPSLCLLLGLLLLVAAAAPVSCNDLDGFELSDPEGDLAAEEAEDGFGVSAAAVAAARAAEARKHQQQAAPAQEAADEAAAAGKRAAPEKGPPPGSTKQDGTKAAVPSVAEPSWMSVFPKYFLEAVMVCVFILYAVKFITGKLHNEAIAVEWANAFCSEGAVLERNFSLLGQVEGQILTKEGHSTFKFYASGRRFCRGMLATLELRSRQDLLSYLLYLIMPKDDTLDVEVFMNDSTMPPIVFAIGDPLAVKKLQKERADLSTYTKLVYLRDRMPKLAADRFACYAESREVAGDIIATALDDLVVEDVWATAGKYVESIIVSSEATGGTQRKVIRAVFKIPSSDKLAEMEAAISAIPSLIDAVGSYKMSADQKKRAEDRRRKVVEESFNTKEKRNERQEIIDKKRAEKAAAEKERLSRLTPEARAKAQEKQEKLQQRRNAKLKVKLMK